MNNNCPGCGTRYQISPQHIGHRFACQKCGQALIVDSNGLQLEGLAAQVAAQPDEALTLPGEQHIATLTVTEYFLYLFPTGKKQLTLSTHRVRYKAKRSGFAGLKSIMLEHVAACMTTKQSNLLLAILAVLFMVLGTIMGIAQSGVYFVAGFFIAVLLLVLYLLTQQRILRLGSAGGAINFVLGHSLKPELRHFIDQLEAAKNNRFLSLRATAKSASLVSSP